MSRAIPSIQLRSRVPNADDLRGMMLTEEDVTLDLRDSCNVYKPDGQPLIMLRKAAIPKEMLDHAYPALHELRKTKTDNRGAYAGATRTKAVFEDGSTSKNSRTRTADGKRHMVASAIIGYFDRQGGRFPYCRETAFTGKQTEEWNTVLPMIQHVSDLFMAETALRSRFVAQQAAAEKCLDYVVKDTVFTTITVNNNVAPSATHQDKGDFKDGMGVISVLRRGQYTGGTLVFPEYRVGVNLDDGDVIFFNSHDWHGVTPMLAMSEDAERISVVYYLRKLMVECLPLAEELARAKARGEAALGLDEDD